MARRLHALLGVSSGILAVNAMVAPQPRATTSSNSVDDGTSPVPTTPPSVNELMKRQASLSEVEVTIFDETCGYMSGSAGAALGCADGYNCWMVPDLSMLLCAASDDSYGFIDCVDSTDMLDSRTCNDVCMANTVTLKCSYSTAPWCRTYSYDNGVVDYDCASTSPSGIVRAAVTYSGEDVDFRSPVLTTVTLGDADSSDDDCGIFGCSGTTTTPGNNNDDPTTSPTGPNSVTTSPVNHNDDDDNGGGSNTGAIVGGVVGGVAALGLIGLAAVFILRRKRASPNPPEQPQPVEQVHPPHPPPPVYSPPQQTIQPQQQMGNMAPPPAGGYYAGGGDAKPGFASPHASMLSATTPGSMAPTSPAFSNNSAYPFGNQQAMSPPPQVPSPSPQFQPSPPQGLVLPQQPQQQPVGGGYGMPVQGQVHEIGTDSANHRGNLHEMG